MAIATLVHAAAVSASVTGFGTTETVIAVSDIEPTNIGGEGYYVHGELGNVLTNAGASTLRLRVRQGNGITGTVVADSGPMTTAAGANVNISCGGVDGSPASQYSLTVQAGAAAQAGTSTGALLVGNASSASA
jgi:hypothetical protein